MTDLDELLKKQAEKHGLASFNPIPTEGALRKEEQYKHEMEEHINQVELENGGFAGFRRAEHDGLADDPKISLDQYESSLELEALDMLALKVRLKQTASLGRV